MNIKTLLLIYKLLTEEAETAEIEYQIATNARKLARRELDEGEQIPEELEKSYQNAKTRGQVADEALKDFENHEWR